MKRSFRFFGSLRGKLTLTYTLVTVMALLVLEMAVIGMLMLLAGTTNADVNEYLSDVVYVLYPQARQYLQPGDEDQAGLQKWLEGVFGDGYASLPPQYRFDSPAAVIVKEEPMYVLSPQGVVLAQASLTGDSLVGRSYSAPGPRSTEVVEAAFSGTFNIPSLYMRRPDGNYFTAVPVRQGDTTTPVVGVIVLVVEPPPSLLNTWWPVMLSVVFFTGLLMIAAVAPLGALFGFIMSRGLTRRLKALTLAADAWSEGDFSLQPQDLSKDEIGYLGMRLRNMAERIQSLLQTQQELVLLEERNRLARDLHDTVKQQAFATLMQVRAARNLIGQEQPEAQDHLNEAEQLIKTSQQELGRLIAELRPAALEGQGLAKAMEQYVHIWSQQAHIPAHFQVQNDRRLPLQLEQALYRVVQEALANAARHSRATQVWVLLDYQADMVYLKITDNGAGFDTQSERRQGFGLHSMQERVAELGGLMVIESAKEKGTTIHVRAPFEDEK